MFPGCAFVRFVFVGFHVEYNDSWNPFAQPSLSLVISCNEEGIMKLLYANFFMPQILIESLFVL